MDPLFDLTGKVAIVTGGGSGMGRASALAFLARGARVVIADVNQASAAETLALAGDAGFGDDRIRFVRTDVSQEDEVAALVETTVERFGGLDCMFNNAGIGGSMAPLLDTTVEDWDRVVAVLMRGVFLGIKHAGRAMRRQGRGGSIISTSSTGGRGGGAGPVGYSAAKAAVENITRNAAVELAPDLIRVNAIAPGFTNTPMLGGADDEAVREMARPFQPLPVVGQPEDIAHAALFLASDAARFITGTSLLVDGGKLAWGPRVFPLRDMGQGIH